MGAEVTGTTFTREDRTRFRDRVLRGTEAIDRMLADGLFTDRSTQPDPLLGMEVELNLVDAQMNPAMCNQAILSDLASDTYESELGQFNIELNLDPQPLKASHAMDFADDLRSALNRLESMAAEHGAHTVMIGMLPTLTAAQFEKQWLSQSNRYEQLEEQIFAARGEDLLIDIEGSAFDGAAEELHVVTGTILPEAACTSIQLHLRLAPEDFANHWNAAQAFAGVQVALAANSPFLDHKALWHETRLPLFTQATDIRPIELKNQGVRPRVWFGERWINSIFDLFEENTRYFPALLPESSPIDPLDELDAGRVPELTELKMHNGTIWRWNRPVYDTVGGHPHVRIENRTLPSGPTLIDMMANAGFFYGAITSLAREDRPIWTRMSFGAAEENLIAGGRDGMDARLYWPSAGWVCPDELTHRILLPHADHGLQVLGVDSDVRDQLLTVIEGRCATRQNGASWQRRRVSERETAGETRADAIVGMLREYLDRMHDGDPVHTWD
ncbi:glutamate-cysteine ligase family protein [Tsukamurella sp. 8F]|uniref:glutamate-cysteine ligase family protein n=1 Tax=unclassified Tsukamurella TaxID=2633480 RepID=UPI0023B93301|nr:MULTISPECIES: glutamate-cysteine ligase family protein [unclassified Tsukamurella]MDF0528407.1 glutamate-cysteine ligase family protein [Tsukamurella sp. 8J]MDF0586232.1 glutamate-cysteine ligase family protein [Tsukamurella sp. 8F]